jgi:hypothetical protein
MIKRGLVLFAMLGRATAAMGQGPSNPPLLIYPFDRIPTDAEIVAALQGSDAHLKEVIIIRAVQNLPPHSLQDTTVRAISDEILKLRHDVQVRFKADPLSVNEGNSHSEHVKGLAQVLMHEQNPAGIDGLVAAFRLNNTKGNDNWHLLATAAYLAVATGDEQLRLQVMDLIDNAGEFERRSMTIQWQHEVSVRHVKHSQGFLSDPSFRVGTLLHDPGRTRAELYVFLRQVR